MNRRIMIALAGAAMALTASAQINSPEAQGYLTRGIKMYQDANYNGCIDQMLQMRHLDPDSEQNENALYYVAMSTLKLGDDEALQLLNAFISIFPQSHHRQEVLKSIGDFYFNQGGSSYGAAIKAYQRVDPKCLDKDQAEEYTYRLAYSNMMMGEYDTALGLFNSLDGTKKYGNAARFYEAYIAYANRDFTRALSIFKDVDKSQEPGNAADYYMAQLYYQQADYKQALQCARNAISANSVPQLSVDAQRIAGESLYKLGKTTEAAPYLWEYVAKSENPQPSAYYILGVEEFNAKNYNDAIKLLQKTVDGNDAMSQNSYLYLGQAYLKNGNASNALMAFDNAYRMNYDPKVRETAFYNYAVALSEGGRAPFTSSIEVYENFLKEFPQSRYAPEINRQLVTGYMQDDNYEKALESINKIANPTPELLAAKQRILMVLGTRDFTADRTTSAMERFEQARAIDANSDITNQATLWIADCYYREKNWDKAVENYLAFLDKAGENDANRQLALYDLGYTRYNQRDYHKALLNFERAAAITPGSLSPTQMSDLYDRMGDCYYAQGQMAKAEAQYSKAYSLNKESADYALFQMARMKGYQGHADEEIQLLDSLMENFPHSALYPAALLAKAESYISSNDYDNAINTYLKLVQDFPTSSYGRNGQLQLASTYLNSDRRAEAIEAYRKVIYTYPTSDEARVAGEDLKRIYAADGNLDEFVAFMVETPNAPEVDLSDVEMLTYESAEDYYLNGKGTDKLESYLKEYPEGAYRADAFYYIAENAFDEGDVLKALDNATLITNMYPDSSVAESAMSIKAECEMAEGKKDIALKTFMQLEQRATNPQMLHYARMQIMRIADNLERNALVLEMADKMLGTSTSGADDENEIRFARALATSRMGKYEDAEKEWAQLSADSNDLFGAMSSYYMADEQRQRGMLDKAQVTISAFLDQSSSQDYWRARGVILLSDILREQGNNFEADQYLKSLRNNYTGEETDIFNMINDRIK